MCGGRPSCRPTAHFLYNTAARIESMACRKGTPIAHERWRDTIAIGQNDDSTALTQCTNLDGGLLPDSFGGSVDRGGETLLNR